MYRYAESLSASIRQTTSLFTILFGVPPFRIGPICNSPANFFYFKDNELRSSAPRPLESWFMDHLEFFFMARDY